MEYTKISRHQFCLKLKDNRARNDSIMFLYMFYQKLPKGAGKNPSRIRGWSTLVLNAAENQVLCIDLATSRSFKMSSRLTIMICKIYKD